MTTGFTEFVARLRAWQVFLILALPFFLSNVFLFRNMPISKSPDHPPSLEDFDALFQQSMLVSLLMVVFLLSWLVSIGMAANRRVEQSLRPKTHFVAVSAVFATGYIAIAPYIWPKPSELPEVAVSTAVLFTLHLLSMAAIFYVLAFSARNIIMAEKQSSVSFFDYSGPFFLMWFFPFGVWVVQPRVNRLVAASC